MNDDRPFAYTVTGTGCRAWPSNAVLVTWAPKLPYTDDRQRAGTEIIISGDGGRYTALAGDVDQVQGFEYDQTRRCSEPLAQSLFAAEWTAVHDLTSADMLSQSEHDSGVKCHWKASSRNEDIDKEEGGE